MKILVIGNGFLGQAIIRRLESDGHEVLIFSRTMKKSSKSTQVAGDISEFASIAKTFQWKPQVVVNTAWITDAEIYLQHVSNYEYASFTRDLTHYCLDVNVKHLILLGTGAEYGPQTTPCVAGITGLNPSSVYAQQKVAALELAKKSLLGSDVRLTWARIFQPYGPNQDEKRLIPYLISYVKSGNLVHLKGSSNILDWITTRDVASAIAWIISNETPIEVDIGTSIGYTNIELLKNLEQLMGDSKQWDRFSTKGQISQEVCVVGKDSPLFKTGWRSDDSLVSGLKWILGL
jgi:nucleoside-diphosphate-sugar epimerase